MAPRRRSVISRIRSLPSGPASLTAQRTEYPATSDDHRYPTVEALPKAAVSELSGVAGTAAALAPPPRPPRPAPRPAPRPPAAAATAGAGAGLPSLTPAGPSKAGSGAGAARPRPPRPAAAGATGLVQAVTN